MFTTRKFSRLFLIVFVLALAVSACAPAATPPPTDVTPDLTSILPPEVVLAGQQWLANELGVQVQDVQLLSSEQVDYSDACLGLGGPDEICAQVITPGWRAVFEVNGQQYEVRTDETGTTIRLAESVSTE